MKLARKSSITHPLGVVLETPLLVPSFSSKGFLFKKTKTRQISEVADFMDVSAEVLTESMLISAYDVYNKHIQPLSQIAKIGSVVFIDSGGYEVSDAHDFPSVFKHPWPPPGVKWTEAELTTILDGWPRQSPAVFVGFDNAGRPFPISIGTLRRALDGAGVTTPIHVFGSLDPLSSSLYFLAGAEIFDGLTWLRYSYRNGQAVYYHNHGVLDYGIHERDSLVTARSLRDNIYYLQRLKYQMLDFLPNHSFDKFEFCGDFLKKSYDTFLTRLGGTE